MLRLTESTTCQRAKAIVITFVNTEHQGNVTFEKILPTFKSNSSPEDGVIEKEKVGLVELIFHVVSEKVVVFDVASWESATSNNLY